MALRAKKSLCLFASLLSPWESTLVKSTKAFSTNLTLDPPSDQEVNEHCEQRHYKRRYALLAGYRGANYYGVCMNPGQEEIPTVGKEIVHALIKTGYADESYLQSANSISQASRTDAGVSALKQVMVLDLERNVDLEELKPYLPEDIRLYGIVRTTKRFIPFRFCGGRSYLYYIPSYVFSPLSMEMHKDYRLTSDTKDKIKRSLVKFLGTKNYHNFTRGRSSHDPRAMRCLSKIELLEPVLKDGFELACIRLEGPSFILNQIRKIIGALVLAVRGYTSEKLIDIALSRQGVMIGRAPPFGLMLEDMNFQWYNKKFASSGFDPIDFSKYNAEVEALKDRILAGVVATEMEYERTKLWVESLQYFSYAPFSKEQLALDASLDYDDNITVLRSERVSVSGSTAAALFI